MTSGKGHYLFFQIFLSAPDSFESSKYRCFEESYIGEASLIKRDAINAFGIAGLTKTQWNKRSAVANMINTANGLLSVYMSQGYIIK